MRFAIVRGARTSNEVWAYMPANYAVLGGGRIGSRSEYVIGGSDQPGWTLDGYVIPRLGSGSIGAQEVTGPQAIAWLTRYANGAAQYELDAAVEEAPPIAVHRTS